MKFSLNPTTAQKMANLRNTVRRLIIILLSLYFLLIIRASFWSSYGKILAESITKQTITNLQNTVTRLGIIVFSKCFCADHQGVIFELLR